MTDFIPGDPANSVSLEGLNAFKKAEDTIKEAETVIDTTDMAVVVPMAESVKEAESLCQHIESLVVGEIATTISDAEKVVAKIAKKITTKNDSLLSEAYSYMDLVGIPVPTAQDLAYAEATGDYLGSVGVAPQIQASTPVANPPSEPYALPPWWQGDNNNPPQPPPQPPPGFIRNPTPSPDAANFPKCGIATIGQTCYMNISKTPDGPSVPVVIRPGEDLPILGMMGDVPFYGYDKDTGSYLCRTGGLSPLGTSCDTVTGVPPAQWPQSVSNTSGIETGSQCPPGSTYQPETVVWTGPDGKAISPTSPPEILQNATSRVVPAQCITTTPQPEFCPLPDKLCGPDRSWKNLPGHAINDDPCKEIEDAISQLSGETLKIGDFIGMATGSHAASTVGDAIINAITGGNNPILGELSNRFAKWLQSAVVAGVNTVNCTSPAMVNASIRQAIINFVQKWTDALPKQLITETQQISNTICQSELPGGSEADAAYLADTITKEEWECWHKAEGDHLGPAEKVLDGKRERIDARNADLLYRRKKIDYEEMTKRMRENGVLRDEDRFAIRDLNEHWPPLSDTVRFMQRDVFDPDAVTRGKLDEDFDKKFQGRAERYADALGTTKEIMKEYWMAHWQLPSYTMAKEWLHRFDGPEQPDSIRFTEADFKELLKQDDWAPGYIDRMVAAAYVPINRTDSIKAYMIHVSSDETFIDQLMTTGYDKETATFMQTYYKKRREINDRKASGYPTLRSAVNAYSRCEMAENEFREIVSDIVIDEDMERSALKAAGVSRKVWERKQAIRTIKRPFILGLTDEIQVTTDLANAKVDSGCIDSLIEQWQRERMRRDKYLSAGQLCNMRERGIISPQQQVIALVRGGWGEDDALLIAEECNYRLSEKAANRARIGAEKAAREMEKRRKAIEKANRLAECGPPPCPANRQKSTHPAGAGQ